MNRFSRFIIYITLDIVLTVVAYSSAYSIRLLTAYIDYSYTLPYVLLYASLFVLGLWSFGTYKRIWSQTSGHEITLIIKSLIVPLVITTFLNAGVVPRPLPWSVYIVGTMLTIAGMIAVRYRSRLLDGLTWRWHAIWKGEFPEIDSERVLVVGAGRSGRMAAWRLQRDFVDKHMRVIGFADDDAHKQGLYVENRPVLGTTEAIPQIVKDHQISLIVFAIHNIDGERFRRVLTACEETNTRIKVMPDFEQMLATTAHSQLLRDVLPEDLIGRGMVTRHHAISMKPVMGKVVLVTGAAGSIGSEISRQMATYEPTKLLLLDNNESGLYDLALDLKAAQPDVDIETILADVTQVGRVRDIFEEYRPQVVYHAAAYKHVPMCQKYPNEAVRVNIGGTYYVAEAANDFEAERFVLISTDKAVEPTNVMGASKRLCELVVHSMAQQSKGTKYTAVRFGNVLSSRGSVVPIFERQIERGGPVTVTHKDMMRFFMSIPEAANLVIHAACMTISDDIFVLRMGEEVRILDVAERLIRLRGLRPYVDIPINFTGIRPGEKLNEVLQYDDEELLDTDHPGITKLAHWSYEGETVSFLQKLSLLLDSGVRSEELALQELLTLSTDPRVMDQSDTESTKPPV